MDSRKEYNLRILELKQLNIVRNKSIADTLQQVDKKKPEAAATALTVPPQPTLVNMQARDCMWFYDAHKQSFFNEELMRCPTYDSFFGGDALMDDQERKLQRIKVDPYFKATVVATKKWMHETVCYHR